MPITRSTSRPDREQRLENAALRKRIKNSCIKAVQEEAFKELLVLIGTGGGKVPYGAVQKLIKKYHSNGFKSVTRKNLYYRLERSKKTSSNESLIGQNISVLAENSAVCSNLSDPSSNYISKESTATDNDTASSSTIANTEGIKCGGRRKGSTKASVTENERKREEVITRCAILYNEEREKATSTDSCVPVGTLKRIVLEEEEKAGLTTNSISLETVRSRVKRKNVTATNPFEKPLIEEVEPIICDFCIRLGKMGLPLTKSTVIEFANSVIAKTEFQEKVFVAKKIRHLKNENTLGVRWYKGFLSRHSSLLTLSGTVIKDVKRRTWVTHENFENMYENVYNTMVEAGVAEEVSEEIKYETGLPSKFKLTRPEYVVFVDETGCNTNQLNDGRVGNEKFILPKQDSEFGAPIGATTDIHFTVLPFISGTGEAVMCAVIFKSEQGISEIPVSWKLGIDITIQNADDTAKVMSGGPTCTFQGKQIPCFYGTSPKASITTELLTEMLKYLDKLGVYDRSVCKPFLLLDGHHSRMMLPFLDYINQPATKWCTCFGVPYATHIWQVNDASSLNGKFKIELTKAKRNYIKHRDVPKFEPTDIVPLINAAFSRSFGNADAAKKAIQERGWNPLNYNLLTVLPNKGDGVVDLTGKLQEKENVPQLPPLPKINVSHGVGSYYVDLLINEELKNEGRKKRNEEIKSEQKTKQQKVEHLKKITKVSSAQLAAHNHYTLDETVRDMVFERNAAIDAAHAAVEQRKQEAERKKKRGHASCSEEI